MSENHETAVILLGHGSRVQGAGRQMEDVASALKIKFGFEMVESCYLSRLGPHFPEVLQGVVERGARKIIVIPYFLHEGLHIRLDIPEMMQHEAARYPNITLILGKNLGYDETLVDLVQKRISESIGLSDVREIPLPSRTQYPVPEGQCEFVPMTPMEAEAYRKHAAPQESGRHRH